MALTTLIVIYSLLNALSPTVKELTLPLPNLEQELKLVQISDIHLGTIHNYNYLQSLVEKINFLQPDIVLITGDFFDSSDMVTEKTISPLNDLHAKTFFVTGNHETYVGLEQSLHLLNSTKVQVLRNEIINYAGVQIIGIDYPEEFIPKNNTIISKLIFDKSKPTVLMFHPPIGLEEASAAGVNLQLSGHGHNGQIFPFKLLLLPFFPRINGLYQYNQTYLYVSPGTGTWGPPLRLGSRSEITLIHLVKR